MFTSDEIKKVMYRCFPTLKGTSETQSALASHVWYVVEDMIVVVPLFRATKSIWNLELSMTSTLEEKLSNYAESDLAASVTRNLAMAIF
jgi:hypothetical protein